MSMTTQDIDGSNGNIAFTIDALAITCLINYWSADFVRDFTEKTTFCTTGWRSRKPGLKQLIGMFDGYLSRGATGSSPAASITDPSYYIASTTGSAYVITADTRSSPSGACSFTFTGHAGRVHTGLRAAMNGEFSVNFESDGQVTTAWITS